MIKKLLKLKKDVWYTIDPKRTDKEEVVQIIKKRIDTDGDFVFNDDYTKFKRIESFNQLMERLGNPTGAVAVIEFRDISEVTFDYSHLPEAKLKTYSSTEWNKKKGRQ